MKFIDKHTAHSTTPQTARETKKKHVAAKRRRRRRRDGTLERTQIICTIFAFACKRCVRATIFSTPPPPFLTCAAFRPGNTNIRTHTHTRHPYTKSHPTCLCAQASACRSARVIRPYVWANSRACVCVPHKTM